MSAFFVWAEYCSIQRIFPIFSYNGQLSNMVVLKFFFIIMILNYYFNKTLVNTTPHNMTITTFLIRMDQVTCQKLIDLHFINYILFYFIFLYSQQ